MTTRDYFRSLRSDLYREDVHAFVCVERLADGIDRWNNPEWRDDIVVLSPPVPTGWHFGVEWRTITAAEVVARYRQVLDLCAEVTRAREDAAARQLGAPEAGSIREMYSRAVTLPEQRRETDVRTVLRDDERWLTYRLPDGDVVSIDKTATCRVLTDAPDPNRRRVEAAAPLKFHPKALEFVFAPLADDSPVARLFGPGRWLR